MFVKPLSHEGSLVKWLSKRNSLPLAPFIIISRSLYLTL